MFIFIRNTLDEYSHYDRQEDKDFFRRHLFINDILNKLLS